MSLNRIINMVINVIIRKLVNAAINGGMRMASRRGKTPNAGPANTGQSAPPTGQGAISQDDLAKRAKIAARTIRRS
ncbi:MAG: hypothetical protein WA784_15950 [Albidovulum sp.]